LALYRRLLKLRRERAVLHAGSVEDVRGEDGVLSYLRVGPGGERVEVHLNLCDEVRFVEGLQGRVQLSTFLDNQDGLEVGGTIKLRGGEGVVVEVVG
jgi:hypothetical protein